MIKADGVRKRFGSKEALGGISCSIPDGSIYGLVGSNGAGKSTLLRILSGVYRPDEGSVLIDGAPVWENPEAMPKDSPLFGLIDGQVGELMDRARKD